MLLLVCPWRENLATTFETDGFKSSISVQKIDPSTLVSIDKAGNKSSFDLCNDFLVSMEVPRTTDFSQFVRLVQKYTEKYGQPVMASDDRHPVPLDALDAVGLRWNFDQEYVSLYFTSFFDSDKLRFFYQSPNTFSSENVYCSQNMS